MSIIAKGIDVSTWQGSINWNKVKNAGIQFAMIRAGYGRLTSQKDKYCDANVKGCEAANIPYGFYWYSYAKDVAGAKAEAAACLSCIKGYKPEYPIAFDIEDNTQYNLPKSTLTAIVTTFCEEIEKAGYYAALYSNLDWLTNKLGDISKFDVWLAQWANNPSYKKSFGMWQYSSKGSVSGISGYVDMNYAYRNYPEIIRSNGLNGFKANSTDKTKDIDIDVIVSEIMSGKWDSGDKRKEKLISAGYDYDAIQARVNEYYEAANKCANIVKTAKLDLKTFRTIFDDVL